MASSNHVMIALQTPDGLAFGYVLDASPRQVSFTVNNNLAVGTSFAWRMELKGYSETIMGNLTVTRGYPARSSGDWPRYDADVKDIPEGDAVLLEVWMEDQEKGGSSRRVEQDPERFIKDMFSEGMRSASQAQTKLVIDRMNERRARREELFKKKKRGIGGDFGLSRESTAAGSSVSRSAVRSQISAALGSFSRRTLDQPAPTTTPSPAAPTPSRSNPTEDAPPGAAPAPDKQAQASRISEEVIAAALQAARLQSGPGDDTPPADPFLDNPHWAAEPAPTTPMERSTARPEPPPAVPAAPAEEPEPAPQEPEPPPAAPAEEPEPATQEPEPGWAWRLDDSLSPPLLELRYPQLGDYGRDYSRHLKNGGMFLEGMQIGARGDKLAVRLVHPGGTLECQAQVVAVMAAGTGLMLFLDKEQKATLAAAAT
jgi:hypothetical protein